MTRRVVGLIADTHGLVRPAVHRALEGVEIILHAGDVGGDAVLAELSAIAPVRAVFGNIDPPDAANLSATFVHHVSDVAIHVSHGHEVGTPTPAKLLARYDGDVLVYGHTHVARVTRAGDRLVVNPGAAGPARFDLHPSVARLVIEGGTVEAEIVRLDDDAAEGRV
jgi:hypothetical protein